MIRAWSPTGLIPWFSKTEGNTYVALLHHPFLFKGKPTQCSRGSTHQSAEAARNEAQGALQEIQEARKIAAGKAFNMQSKNVKMKYRLLIRIRSSPGAFTDLPRSVADATELFRAEEGSSTERLFWS